MRSIAILFLALLLVSLAASQGSVADADTAIKIAEKRLMQIYGKKKIESERPFTAELKAGVWTVGGTIHCKDERGNSTTRCPGGVAVAKISEANGKILSAYHTK